MGEAITPQRTVTLTADDIQRIPDDIVAKLLGLGRTRQPRKPARPTDATGGVEPLRVRVSLATLAGEGRAATDRGLADLVDALLRDEAHTAPDLAVFVDNAKLRARYLADTPTLTAEQVHALAGSGSRNRSEPASRWKRRGRIFAIQHHGKNLFPAFQLADGRPRPIIADILTRLPGDWSAWQTALWFASANGWLDGRAPSTCLARPEAVLAAADHAGDRAIG